MKNLSLTNDLRNEMDMQVIREVPTEVLSQLTYHLELALKSEIPLDQIISRVHAELARREQANIDQKN